MSFAIFLIPSRIPILFEGDLFPCCIDCVLSNHPLSPIIVFPPFFSDGKSGPRK
jgi:hypothetical protein